MSNDIFKSKPIEELTFTDDGMFQAVLHEEDICAEIIERLLHVKVNHIEYPELEKQIAPFYTTKGVRLDVYLKKRRQNHRYRNSMLQAASVRKTNTILPVYD